jgi:IS66 Orf2 like protein
MIALPAHGRVYLACGSTDMRRGFDGLAVMVQEVLMQDPHSGALFAFKGKRGDLIKLLSGMVRVCVCSPSVWKRDASSGRWRRREPYLCRRRNWRCCLKALTGAPPCGAGIPNLRVEKSIESFGFSGIFGRL